MVQPVATTSCYSSILEPIVTLPYQLVSGTCSAIGSLVEKIANFVISIFTTIAHCVRSRVCGETIVTPPAGASPTTGTNAAPSGPDLLTGPRNEKARVFLHALLEDHQNEKATFSKRDLLKIVENPAAVQSFFAHLLVLDFIMDSEFSSRDALPFLVTQPMGPNSQTFIAKMESLHNNFGQFAPDLKNEIQEHFVSTHLRWSNAPSENDENIQFHEADNPELQERVRAFYAEVKNLAKMFIQHNTTFTAAVETVRIEEESKWFLSTLLNDHCYMIKTEQRKEVMKDEATAKPFFAHLLIRNLGMEASPRGPLPYMLTNIDPTLMPGIEKLYFTFSRFEGYSLRRIIPKIYDTKHLGYIPDEDDKKAFAFQDDQLKEAECFQTAAEALAAKLLQNSIFSAAVNAARLEYLEENS